MSHLAPLAALALLLASRQDTTQLRFAPADGSRCTKTFVTTGTLAQTVRGLGDEEAPFEMPVSIERTIRIADQYVQSKAGRPLRLKRVFEHAKSRLESTIEGSGEEGANKRVAKNLTSQVEGLPLEFRWDEKTARYTKSLQNSPSPLPEPLQQLEEDTDLRDFLPPTDVKVGDEWQVPAHALRHLLSPGGDLLFEFKEGGAALFGSLHLFGNRFGDLAQHFPGQIKASLRLASPESAVIDILYSIDSREALAKTLEGEDRARSTKSVRYSSSDEALKFRGTGSLTFDRKAGRVATAVLTGQLEASWTQATERGDDALRSRWGVAGKLNVELSIQP